MNERAPGASGGFTLVEILIALGIMAVGITAVIGVFVMATATHKRAVDETTAALIAQTALADLRGRLTASFDAAALEPAGMAAVAPGAESATPPVLYFRKNAADPSYPGYRYDVLLTPVDAQDPALADAFHAEVVVRWLATGKERGETFHTVVARSVRVRDLRE